MSRKKSIYFCTAVFIGSVVLIFTDNNLGFFGIICTLVFAVKTNWYAVKKDILVPLSRYTRKLKQDFIDWKNHKPDFFHRTGEENEADFPGEVLKKPIPREEWPEFFEGT